MPAINTMRTEEPIEDKFPPRGAYTEKQPRSFSPGSPASFAHLTPPGWFSTVSFVQVDSPDQRGNPSVTSPQPPPIPFAARAIPFDELLAAGKIPEGLLTSEYIAQQFVERLVHYVLSVPSGSYTMAQLSKLLEQLDPRSQVFFFKRLKENSPESLKDFAPLYYGFMNEFHSLLFT
ncbi:hypothetical protein [Nitrospira sp. Nam80]